MEFIRAESVPHASQLLAEDPDGTKVIAGGTGLVLMMKQRLVEPKRLVAIDHIPQLAGITADDSVVRLGGCTRLSAAARHPTVAAELPGLCHALAVVGNVRIRNVATVGGNLVEADYASDPPPVLISLGAVARVEGTEGVRHVPVDELITDYYTTSLAADEVVTAVEIPRRPLRRSVYEKFRTRSSEDRPCVGVAAAAEFRPDGAVADLSVAVGAIGPRPQALPDVTRSLRGHALDAVAIEHVATGYAAQLKTMDDHRGSSWYRTRLVRVLVARALSRLVTRPEEGRGA